jgi:hypothetical protein
MQVAPRVGQMLNIYDRGYVLTLGVLTVRPWVWNQHKPMQVEVRGSVVSLELWNRSSRYWFQNCLRLHMNVYDLVSQIEWRFVLRTEEQLFFCARRSVLVELSRKCDVFQGLVFSSELSLRKSVVDCAFKKVWPVQGLVFSSELSVRKSVSDCHTIFIIPGNEPRPTLPGYSSPHRNIWYPSTRLVFPLPLPFPIWLHTTHSPLHTQNTVTPNSSLIPLTLDYSRLPRLAQSSTSLCLYKSLQLRSVTCSHSCTLKMEAIGSSETLVLIRATRRHLPEDDNHLWLLHCKKQTLRENRLIYFFLHELPEMLIIW